MKPFTRHEIIGVTIIFLLVTAVTVNGLLVSLRRARDAQRMADLGSIANALDQFHEEYGFFPPSDNGRIQLCKADNFENILNQMKAMKQFDRTLFFSGLRACEWGSDTLEDPINNDQEKYLKSLPVDPKANEGTSYSYLSDTKRYQIFASLEGGVDEDVYNAKIYARNLGCGNKICSVGKSYADTPLDKDLEEYAKELEDKQRNASSNR